MEADLIAPALPLTAGWYVLTDLRKFVLRRPIERFTPPTSPYPPSSTSIISSE
jgi:hypothetical protein